MRKLKLQVQISVDGFIAGPNGEMDWMVWDWDQQLKDYVTELTDPVDTIVLGRKLAEGFIPTWNSLLDNPEMAAFARKMVETPKVVFTKTIKTHEWGYTTLASGDLVEEINAIKNKEGNDIIAYGGSSFVSSLITAGLIDEFHLFINPTAIGKGMPIFATLSQRQQLHLVSTKLFDCGIVVIKYEKKNA